VCARARVRVYVCALACVRECARARVHECVCARGERMCARVGMFA